MSNNFVKYLTVLGFVFLVIFGCSKNQEKQGSPVDVLTRYVSISFGMNSFSDKEKLTSLSTKEVKQTLEKMDEAAFKVYFVDSKRKFIKLKVRDERSLSENTFSVTYEISYIDTKKEAEAIVTNKKHALFEKVDGKWLIAEVRNIKTFIEHKNELSL